MDSLRRIFQRHNTPADPINGGGDKGSVHSYLGFYEDLFEPLRREVMDFLEIGVAEGHSLRMWHEYFERAEITGIDVMDLKQSLYLEGLYYIQCDTTNAAMVHDVVDISGFSVIVDDADHRFTSQLATWENLRGHLKAGGIYVIEDIQDIDASYEDLRSRGFFICDFRAVKGRADDVLAYRIG